MPPDNDDVVIAGHIGGAYGVQGWVRVVSYTDPPEGLLDYRPWLLDRAGHWTEAGLAEARRHRDAVVARFEGVADRDAAQALAGTRVGFARDALPVTAPGEYYWRDLTGLAVIDQRGRRLGVVSHLIPTGAHDVLVIAAGGAPGTAGGEDETAELLIPFHAQFVRDVRLDERVIDVEWDG
jgi:16S rRNA processing protein RimM